MWICGAPAGVRSAILLLLRSEKPSARGTRTYLAELLDEAPVPRGSSHVLPLQMLGRLALAFLLAALP